jgi:uncharacterized protein (TIGR03083 family)
LTSSPTTDTLAVARDELDAFIDTTRRLTENDWHRPTSLGDWAVRDLAAHVAEISWRQAEAFHRYRIATPDAPGPAPVAVDVRHLPTRLAASAEHLRAATQFDFEESTPIPLPFAALPASIAAQVIAIEYGVHRYDLHRSLNDRGSLHPEVVRYIIGQAPIYLLMIGRPAGDGAGYRLRSDSLDLAVVPAGDKWQLADAHDDVCTVTGSDEVLALFVMGRVPHDDPRLTQSGPTVHGRFKALFPGP